MPTYTVEVTYHLPVYKHRTVEAADVAEACRLALADDNWDDAERDYDSSGPERVTGAWLGAEAYQGPELVGHVGDGAADQAAGSDRILRDAVEAIVTAHRGDTPDEDDAAAMAVHDMVEMLREALAGERTVTRSADSNALQHALAAVLPLAVAHVEDWESGAADGTYADSDALPAARAVVDAAAALLAAADAPAPDPYELAARAAGWDHGGDAGGFVYHRPTWGSWKAAASWSGEDGMEPDGHGERSATYGTWRECCEGEGIDVAGYYEAAARAAGWRTADLSPGMIVNDSLAGQDGMAPAVWSWKAAAEYRSPA
ncbi:MAG: hypothetical protein KIS96_03605 [Bauldia sp.]|nr:hypothetical protein [Bauldia sp.]